jgi:hypothetical protein
MIATVTELASKLESSMADLVARIGELEGRMLRIERAVTASSHGGITTLASAAAARETASNR